MLIILCPKATCLCWALLSGGSPLNIRHASSAINETKNVINRIKKQDRNELPIGLAHNQRAVISMSY